MTVPILEEIKKSLGVEADNIGFDYELLVFINSTAASLVQMGVSELDIDIDESTDWPTFGSIALGRLVKHHITLRTKVSFDPTASETIAKSLADIAVQLEGRILYENEAIANP